jgi:hypothetical protein
MGENMGYKKLLKGLFTAALIAQLGFGCAKQSQNIEFTGKVVNKKYTPRGVQAYDGELYDQLELWIKNEHGQTYYVRKIAGAGSLNKEIEKGSNVKVKGEYRSEERPDGSRPVYWARIENLGKY